VQTPRPKAAKGWVIVKVMASALCGSDLHAYFSDKGWEATPGHEVAGEVVEVGEGVSEIRPKGRVALYTVALFGLGPVGLGALLILRLLNCKVIAVGFFEFC